MFTRMFTRILQGNWGPRRSWEALGGPRRSYEALNGSCFPVIRRDPGQKKKTRNMLNTGATHCAALNYCISN